MIEKIFTSKQFLVFTWVIVLCLGLLLSFFAGARFGFARSFASCRYHESYRKNFEGFGRESMPGRGGVFPDSFGDHGVFGQVLSRTDDLLVLRDKDGIEKIVYVLASTTIMKQKERIQIGEIAPEDHMMIIGEISHDGKVHAKFMRVLPEVPPMWKK